MKHDISPKKQIDSLTLKILEIVEADIEYLLQKQSICPLVPDDMKRLETLSKIVSGQQKYQLDLKKVEQDGKIMEKIALTQDQLDTLKRAAKR